MAIMFIKILWNNFRVALFAWAGICEDRYVHGHNIPKGTDLDGHSFCCFEVAGMHSFIVVALTEAEGSISNNGPSGSGNRLKYR